MFKYDNKNCLVNLSNSILKRFNAPTYHESISVVDDLLKKHKKIVLFLFDGMGKNVMAANKEETKDLRAHVFHDVCSTFPPTTVAATNALLSGKYPSENGWFSWSQPFHNWAININVFTAQNSQTGEVVKNFDYYKLAKYDNIAKLINKANNKEMAAIFMEAPIDEDGHKTKDEMFEKVDKFLSNVDEGFVYAYTTEPDHKSHTYGITSPEVKAELVEINDKLTKFAKEHPDYLVLGIADHGHINIRPVFLEDYPELEDTMDKPMCFEGRAANFKIKEGRKDDFVRIFKEIFKDSYELYTKQEVLDNEFYGPNPMPITSSNLIGDFIAVAVKDVLIIDKHEHDFFLGHHAGGTIEEGVVSLICYND